MIPLSGFGTGLKMCGYSKQWVVSFFWVLSHTGLNTPSQKKNVNRIVRQTIGCMEKVGGGMVFGKVIGKIIHTRSPVDQALPLVGPAFDPVRLPWIFSV